MVCHNNQANFNAEFPRQKQDLEKFATDIIGNMEQQLAQLQRTHRRYLKHGAVNAAAELENKIDGLERAIGFENEMFRMTFY